MTGCLFYFKGSETSLVGFQSFSNPAQEFENLCVCVCTCICDRKGKGGILSQRKIKSLGRHRFTQFKMTESVYWEITI